MTEERAGDGSRDERQYAGWISLDFNYVDMPPGVTIEQDMAAHRTYLAETLRASLKT